MRRAFLLVVLLVLVLAGCGQQRDDGPVYEQITGKQGVVVEQAYEPGEVFPGEEFSLSYEITNRGASSVTQRDPGQIFLSYDKLYFGEPDIVTRFRENEFWLQGRSRFREGESSFITVYFTANELQRQSQQAETPVMLSVCYPYESDVTAQVCLERDRQAQRGAVACTNRALRPSSPGAPIGVRSVDVRTARADDGLVPSFRIELENYGEGIPSVTACDAPDVNERLNTVRVSAFLLDEQLDCGNESRGTTARFSRGRAIASCSLPADSSITRGDGNFISLLSVEADYTYRESARSEVVIRRE